MARKTQARVVVNRKALHEIEAGLVDGLEALGERFVQIVRPPDAEPFGQGLVTTPDWGVWAGGKKVAGTAAKPRSAPVKRGVTLLVGEGFPGRLQETGTVNHAPQPHVTPAVMSMLGGLEGEVRAASMRRLRSVR